VAPASKIAKLQQGRAFPAVIAMKGAPLLEFDNFYAASNTS